MGYRIILVNLSALPAEDRREVLGERGFKVHGARVDHWVAYGWISAGKQPPFFRRCRKGKK